jgi:RNA polymerase sigma-70 factor (ECF subfamily)
MNRPDHDPVAEFARRRDEESFRELFRAFTPPLLLFAIRLAEGSRTDGEDLVQETWIRAVERFDSYAGRSSFRTWLIGILINCDRERRRRQRGPVAIGNQEPDTPHSSFDLERAIAELPEGARQVLILHAIEGYTHEEVGELLGISPGTSKSQLFNARRILRSLLQSGGAKEIV